jgi:Flp pilus assembly protein TadB
MFGRQRPETEPLAKLPFAGSLSSAKQRFSQRPPLIFCKDSRPARQPALTKEVPMFIILAVVLVVLWLGGFFVLHVSSFLIHLLLIFAIISIIMHFVSGGRRAV